LATNHKRADTLSLSDERTSLSSNPDDDFSVEKLKLPAMLDIPDKLIPIILRFNDFNYFLLDGGRSSAKTQSVGRFLLYLAEQKNLRIVCGRELWTNVEESVYTVLADLIRFYYLNFDISASKITHRITGTTINFRGFREQGAADIKGLEGVDILWIDEGEKITKNTLDIILPTIRKNKSKVFITMNRHVEQDPAYVMFINRNDCLSIHIDYLENKHCPEKALNEARVCRAQSEEDYQHIWLGQPLLKSEDYLFGMDMLRASCGLDMNRIGVSRSIMGIDVARFGDCETVFSILKSHGPVQWEQYHQEAYKHKGIDETVGKSLALQNDFSIDAVAIDDDGLEGVADFIDKYDFELFRFHTIADWKDEPDYEKYATRRTAAYFKLKDWIEKGWLKIMSDAPLIEQLLTIRYKYEKNGRKILFTKDEMRKEGIRSPDRADALAIAVFYADTLMTERFNQPSYAPLNTELVDDFRHDSLNPAYAGQE
jgi:hypothetical protein